VFHNILSLESLAIEDAKKIFELVQKNREHLKYLAWIDDVRSLGLTQEYISKRIQKTAANAECFKIILNKQIVGIFNIKYICHHKSEAEIGYWLAKSVQGFGIVSKTIVSIKEYLKNKNIKTIKVCCLDKNAAGINVIKRVGGVIDTIKDYRSIEDESFNLNIFNVET
jgi:ribosomal-protein-serine acetyltransferase